MISAFLGSFFIDPFRSPAVIVTCWIPTSIAHHYTSLNLSQADLPSSANMDLLGRAARRGFALRGHCWIKGKISLSRGDQISAKGAPGSSWEPGSWGGSFLSSGPASVAGNSAAMQRQPQDPGTRNRNLGHPSYDATFAHTVGLMPSHRFSAQDSQAFWLGHLPSVAGNSVPMQRQPEDPGTRNRNLGHPSYDPTFARMYRCDALASIQCPWIESLL